MIFIQIIMFVITILGLLYCKRYSGEWIKDLDVKEHKLYPLYPLADGFLNKFSLYHILNRNESITNSLKALHITGKAEMIVKIYWCKKAAMVIITLLAFQFLSLMVQLQAISNSVIIEDKYIMRPEQGEGKKEVELRAAMKDMENLESFYEIILDIEERVYTRDELKIIFEKAIQHLDSQVLGSNKAANKITEKLNFLTTIPGSGITVSWKPEKAYIKSDGSIVNDDIDKDGITTEVTAILSYGDINTEHHYWFHILPKAHNKKELFQKELMEEISRVSEDTKEDRHLELPTSIKQYQIFWSEIKKNNESTLFLFGLVVSIFVWYLEDKDLEKRMNKRKAQILIDYPEIVNKFTLLVNAGMTIKQAWYKIAEDYNVQVTAKNISKKARDKRYAYEEMIATVRELKLGVPESVAYDQYGRRVGAIPYIKFTSLMTQNLKKGNKGFTEQLTKEALEAFINRKEVAKRLGEEAGTKLLAPMMIMLLIVFMIILIPAFMSFGS
jgi:hypothetical protein